MWIVCLNLLCECDLGLTNLSLEKKLNSNKILFF